MREIIYDAAVSLDGFIAGPGGDASAFPGEGDHIAPYFDRLARYGTVIMGRHTYEYGYGFGLEPGARAYPHMDHHIFSTTLSLPDDADVTIVRSDWRAYLDKLRAADGAPVYLCGGGQFAGWVLEQGLIDRLILKLAPLTLGAGVPLFAGGQLTTQWQRRSVTPYANGVTLLELTR
ncbi:dihydrofolate reductase family protein [Aliiroseovarius sp. S2029]|uniref:dihydrofolate reductase family protein n=1 Tax=Aliiroseovarius sp. S2029 TaxID=2936988 RepID=UPI0020C14676|nr:dihydrofolate reductase family protein [Aliiroseovarius sp. S2029]MCK8483615.1 dihydrofolate reductase family protein [Aliiroseovarius sp. S2029]